MNQTPYKGFTVCQETIGKSYYTGGLWIKYPYASVYVWIQSDGTLDQGIYPKGTFTSLELLKSAIDRHYSFLGKLRRLRRMLRGHC